jgi:putative protein kinase ArgK-like GTPase of G3E family
VESLLATVLEVHQQAARSGQLERKKRAYLRRQLEEALAEGLMRRARERVLTAPQLDGLVDRLAARELDPMTAAEQVLGRMGL